MTQNPHAPAAALPSYDELAACLLDGLGQRPPRTAARVDGDRLVELYRETIETLEDRVANGDGHAPMSYAESALLCRCVLTAATLAEAIELAAEFCAMLKPRAGELTLRRRGATAVFSMNSLRQQPSSASCLVDMTGLFSYLQLFSWLIGEPLRPSVVVLGYPDRSVASPFLSLFDAPVYAGGNTYRIEFPATLLARPVLRRADELPAFLESFPYRVVAATADTAALNRRVRTYLETALARQQPLPGPAELGALLGMGEATLRRRLRAEGTSYIALREDCLRAAAERHLRDTDWEIEHIAERLGFSDAGTFRRAFRRWTGVAPSQLRKRSAPAGERPAPDAADMMI